MSNSLRSFLWQQQLLKSTKVSKFLSEQNKVFKDLIFDVSSIKFEENGKMQSFKKLSKK